MHIINYNILKDSIQESFKFNKTLFKNKQNNVYIENISYPKFFINFDIVARNLKEYNNIKKELEENIDKLVIVPIYSTYFILDDDIDNTNLITNSNINLPFFNKGDYLLYSSNFKDFEKVLITNVNLTTNEITLETNISIEKDSIITNGKVLSLDNSISIDSISNTYKKFNISCEEL